MELLRHELYKIFSKKVIYVVLAVIVGMYMIPAFMQRTENKEIYDVFKQYEGGKTEETLKNLKSELKDIDMKIEKGEGLTHQESIKHYWFRSYVSLPKEKVIKIKDKDYSLKEMEKILNNLEKEGKVDTFEYKNNKLAYDMIKKLPDIKFSYNEAVENASEFTVSSSLISILLILGLAPLFSDEHQCKTSALIFSTKHGRKKLTKTKVNAGLIYCLAIILIISIIFFSSAFVSYGLTGWKNHINSSYWVTPYNFTFSQYYLVGLLYNILGAIALSLIIMFISIICKNNMLTFFFSLCLWLSPILLETLQGKNKLIEWFSEFNIIAVMRVKGIFRNYNTYNIFNHPVLYPILSLIICTVSIVIFLILVNEFGKKQYLN